jgi:hypothetical protein
MIIYEVGAGNGTLMRCILDHIKVEAPSIYQKTSYHIIEISNNLAKEQRKRIGIHPVTITNKSIFDWDTVENRPCFFLGMEVLDNLSHDLIRYDMDTKVPLQGAVEVNKHGDFQQVFEPLKDPLAIRYLEARKKVGYISSLLKPSLKNWIEAMNPFQANMTDPEYIPTNAFLLLEILAKYFHHSKVVFSDFDVLDKTIEGINGPVVQTRYKNTMVPCSTYLVSPGLFDIFFPTDFKLLAKLYENMYENSRSAQVSSHAAFLTKYGDLKSTRTKGSDNPMIQYYENVSFFTT